VIADVDSRILTCDAPGRTGVESLRPVRCGLPGGGRVLVLLFLASLPQAAKAEADAEEGRREGVPISAASTRVPAGDPVRTFAPAQETFAPDLSPNLSRAIAETVAFNIGLWAYDRYVLEKPYSQVTPGSISANLRGGWKLDTDGIYTNEFLHPYAGTVYFSAARSSGLGFWPSGAVAFGGSLMWKIAGENGPPSTNDQITTPIAGMILGEAMLRVYRIILDTAAPPDLLRRFAATVLLPAAAINDGILVGNSRRPPASNPYEGRLSLGAMTGIATGPTGGSVPIQPRLELRLTSGLPDEVRLRDPFDHLDLAVQVSSASTQPWTHADDLQGASWLLSVRGLALGGATPRGESSRTLFGLFGTFDYGGTLLLRLAQVGAGPGVVLSVRDGMYAFDATLLGAVTFGTDGGFAPMIGERDYRFGVGASAVTDLRLRVGGRIELRATARAFGVPAADGGGSEYLVLSSGSLLVRAFGSHALGIDYTWVLRAARYPAAQYDERANIIGISYSYHFSGG